jgi:hypothetical protein
MASIAESDYEGQPLDEAIKESIRDIQNGINIIESKLLLLIDQDIVDPMLYLSIQEQNQMLLNLVKELIMIVKEVKPSKADLDIAKGMMDVEMKGI